MKGLRGKRQPTFFWRGLLIVLPVIALATMGLLSLRQDRLLARQEAIDRAQTIAATLLPQIKDALLGPALPVQFDNHTFQVDHLGQLVYPPAFSAVLEPKPLQVTRLSAEQAPLWQLAMAHDEQAHEQFLRSDPPENFAAAALYNLALRLAERGDAQRAAENFTAVSQRYPNAQGESGLPLQPLAQLKLLELVSPKKDPRGTPDFASIESFCSNVVTRPSVLTPYLLQRAGELAQALDEKQAARQWQTNWEQQESARDLYSAARGHFQAGIPGLFWFSQEAMANRSSDG